jgi:predicted DCC family thiol-disulfide oxidoreductase YuxK
MFRKIEQTAFPPKDKPLMVFDGNCGFCKYWVIRWKKISGLGVEYKSYQEVAVMFGDIPENDFKQAVRYIDVDGRVFNGPDAAYITYFKKDKAKFLHQWYADKSWFMSMSDYAYQFVADNRNTMSKITVWMFGKNPANPKPFWAYYLLGLVLLISLLFLL